MRLQERVLLCPVSVISIRFVHHSAIISNTSRAQTNRSAFFLNEWIYFVRSHSIPRQPLYRPHINAAIIVYMLIKHVVYTLALVLVVNTCSGCTVSRFSTPKALLLLSLSNLLLVNTAKFHESTAFIVR